MSTTKKIKSNGNGNGNGNGHHEAPVELVKMKRKKFNGDSTELIEELAGESFDVNELLKVLIEVRNGNFDVKMPYGKVGVSGKVCDALNDIIFINKKLVTEFFKVRKNSGKERKKDKQIINKKAK